MKTLKKAWTRLKNKKVAMAVSAGILLILVNAGVIDVEMSNKIESMVDTALSILVALGIFANPDSHITE